MDHDNSGVESLPSDHFDINSIIDDNGYDSFPADSWSWTKIFVGIFLVFVILVSIFGNLLVCVAVGYDRRLRRLGNFFIVSLAIADLCVGALVMTFALANDLLEYWPFGPELCEIWIAFDISGSTCSIINLCAIALDRFVHIKDPMRYNRWMNRRIVGGAVTMIWVISGGLSFIPIALGWHRPEPIPLNSVNSSPRIGTKLNEAEKAILSQLFAAGNVSLSQHNGTSMPTASVPTHHRILHHAHKLNQSLSIISQQIPSPMSTSHISGQNPVSDALLGPHSAKQHLELPDPGGHTLIPLPQCALDLTPSYAVVSSIISFYVPCLVMVYLYIKLYKICQKHVKSIKSMARYQPVMVAEHLPSGPTKTPKNMKNNRSNARNNKEKNQNNTTTNGQGTANSIDGNNNSRKFQKKSIESGQLATIQKQSNHPNQMHHQQQYVQQQQQQQQNHSQSGTNEHKAAITLGIIMGTFLACWMPFFCMNILAAYCKSCISPMVFKVLTWLGYFNSSLNPAIYSIFNTEFRDAFRRILVRGFMANDPERCVSRLLPCREKRNLSNSQSGQSSSGPVPAGNGNSRQLSNANKNLQQNENFERKQETRTVSVHRETAPTDSTAKASSHRHELPEQNIQLTAPQNRNKSSDIDVSSDSGHESHDNDKCITNNETALNKSRKLENSKDATAVTSCLKNSEHCLIGVVVNSSTIDNETNEDNSDGSLTKDIVHRQNDGISVPDTQSDLVGVTQHPEQQQQQQLKSNRFSLRFVRPSKSRSSKSKVECRQNLKQTQQYQSLDQTDLKPSNDSSVRPSLEYLSKQFSSLDIDPISPVKESCEPHPFPVTISTLPDISHQHLTSSPPSHHHSQQPHSIRTEL